jgi:hypothetical protein
VLRWVVPTLVPTFVIAIAAAVAAVRTAGTLRLSAVATPIKADCQPMVRRPQLQSPLARAVVPVGVGIVFFAILGLALWGVAALISNGNDQSSNLFSNHEFKPGSAIGYAQIVKQDGPIIFPDLLGTDGDRTVVLDHVGDDAAVGWVMYLAHPNDRPISCKVTQIRHTSNFTDCAGRIVAVDALAPPERGIAPTVSPDGVLSLNLVPKSATTTTVARTSTP